MDWNVFDIFKKAEFNTLMLAGAITGWVLFFVFPENIYVTGIAVLCSAYCAIRLIVYSYKKIQQLFENRKKRKSSLAYQQFAKEEKEKEEKKKMNHARYVYDTLYENNKKIIKTIVKTGTKSNYSNVYILWKNHENSRLIEHMRSLLYYGEELSNWIYIEENHDSWSFNIKDHLNSIIVNEINEES